MATAITLETEFDRLTDGSSIIVRRIDMFLRHNCLFKFVESRTYRILADKPNRGEGEADINNQPVDLAQLGQVGNVSP